ncbi:MAG: sugar phosphate nucleotidyltransferase [Desulfocucumaceae bacterium]
MKICAAILAGGSGERFWPLSRKSRPKQFLSLVGAQSLVRQTIDRLDGLVLPEDIYIVTLRKYKNLVKAQVPGISEENILTEPCGRDTSAAVGLAAFEIARNDHFIADSEKFTLTLKAAAAAASGGTHLVTLGIPPVRPETSFGYIQRVICTRLSTAFHCTGSLNSPRSPAWKKPASLLAPAIISGTVEYLSGGLTLYSA